MNETPHNAVAACREPLIPINEVGLAPTRLRSFSPAKVYRMIRAGQLGCVRIGRRRYLTSALIDEAIARLSTPWSDTEVTGRALSGAAGGIG